MKLNSKLYPPCSSWLVWPSLGVVVAFLNIAAETIMLLLLPDYRFHGFTSYVWSKKKSAPTWAAFIVTLLVLLAALSDFYAGRMLARKAVYHALPEYTAQAESSQTSIEINVHSWGFENLGLDSDALG